MRDILELCPRRVIGMRLNGLTATSAAILISRCSATIDGLFVSLGRTREASIPFTVLVDITGTVIVAKY